MFAGRLPFRGVEERISHEAADTTHALERLIDRDIKENKWMEIFMAVNEVTTISSVFVTHGCCITMFFP